MLVGVFIAFLGATASAHAGDAGPVAAPLPEQAVSTTNRNLPRSLTGAWRSSEYKVKLSKELDQSIWGDDAYRTRRVELTIEPDGGALLQISSSVVDGRGRTQPDTARRLEAHLKIGLAEIMTPSKPVRPEVSVLNAEERFLDDADDKWPIEGATVRLFVPSLEAERMELLYDGPQGRGSFSETLTRHGGSTSRN
jgi:hypothetical protein